MSIENITNRILQEAKDDAEAAKKAATEEASQATANAKVEAMTISENSALKSVEDAKTLKERKEAVAELEARKLRLGAKQDMINKSFEMAKNAILAMDDEKYQQFLFDRLKDYDEGEVLLNSKDKERIGTSLADKLSSTNLKVSDDTADIDGGFILRNGLVSINGSLETILDSERKEITAQIAETLFS